MAIVISDSFLREAGLDEGHTRIEIACRLFDADEISLPLAARLAGLERGAMEDELLERGIPIYRPDISDYKQDLQGLDRLRG